MDELVAALGVDVLPARRPHAGRPGSGRRGGAAAAAARRDGQDVLVLPTASALQSLSALAVHDPTRRSGEDVVAMADAAAGTRTAALLVAETEALTWVGRCEPGDVLGITDGEVVLIAPDLSVGALWLAHRMLREKKKKKKKKKKNMAAERGLLHLRDDRDVLADLQARDVGEPPAVDVAARVVAQQIADGLQRQLGGQQLGAHARRAPRPAVWTARSFHPQHQRVVGLAAPVDTTSTSGWLRRRSAASPSARAASVPAPSSAVTISPPPRSMR